MNHATSAGPDAHRPHITSRLRLVPLGVVTACVLACAVVGAVNSTAISSEATAAAPVGAEQGKGDPPAVVDERAADPCTPAFDTALSGEPWTGSQRATSEATFKAEIAQEDPAYVVGRKGWHYFTDYQAANFSQGIGRITQSVKQRNAWADFFARSQRTAKRLGSQYFVSIAPGNWGVYRQFLPAWAQKLRGTTSLDKLMSTHPDLPWIDTRSALRGADDRTYEPLNSHWTPYGGWVAWNAIATCLRDHGIDGVGVPAVKRVKVEPNLNEFAMNGVPDGKPQRTVPVYAKKHPRTVIRHIPDGKKLTNTPDDSVDMLLLPVRTTTKGAETDKKLLVLRDSTGSALSPLWSNSFATTIQYNHGVGTNLADPPNLRKLVKKYRPDVVLFVMTERFFYYDPPA